MAERQIAGFDFEHYVENELGVNRNGHNYTDKWDGDINGFPISIKHTAQGQAICCADLFRQASIAEDFIMIVDYYTNNSNDIHFLYIPGKAWHSYFMDLEDFEEKFRTALNNVSNDKTDDIKWTKYRKDCVAFWKEHTNKIITVNGKRDHKDQKRWQCSINKTNFFKELLPKYEISKEEYFKCLEKLRAMDEKMNLTGFTHLPVQYLYV